MDKIYYNKYINTHLSRAKLFFFQLMVIFYGYFFFQKFTDRIKNWKVCKLHNNFKYLDIRYYVSVFQSAFQNVKGKNC